jgi:4a-hydroxytetrahydrobiopterin dehydratase
VPEDRQRQIGGYDEGPEARRQKAGGLKHHGLKTVKESTMAGSLAQDAIEQSLKSVPGWEVANGELTRTFKFQDYHEAMAFVNATAWISHGEDHHPDIELGYNTVKMRYSTHSAGGLTESDFRCARRVNTLVAADGTQ